MIVTGISGGAELLGKISVLNCPTCSAKVVMPVISTYISPKVLHVPMLKLRRRSYAYCPHCSGKFSLGRREKIALKNGLEELLILNQLKPV